MKRFVRYSLIVLAGALVLASCKKEPQEARALEAPDTQMHVEQALQEFTEINSVDNFTELLSEIYAINQLFVKKDYDTSELIEAFYNTIYIDTLYNAVENPLGEQEIIKVNKNGDVAYCFSRLHNIIFDLSVVNGDFAFGDNGVTFLPNEESDHSTLTFSLEDDSYTMELYPSNVKTITWLGEWYDHNVLTVDVEGDGVYHWGYYNDKGEFVTIKDKDGNEVPSCADKRDDIVINVPQNISISVKKNGADYVTAKLAFDIKSGDLIDIEHDSFSVTSAVLYYKDYAIDINSLSIDFASHKLNIGAKASKGSTEILKLEASADVELVYSEESNHWKNKVDGHICIHNGKYVELKNVANPVIKATLLNQVVLQARVRTNHMQLNALIDEINEYQNELVVVPDSYFESLISTLNKSLNVQLFLAGNSVPQANLTFKAQYEAPYNYIEGPIITADASLMNVYPYPYVEFADGTLMGLISRTSHNPSLVIMPYLHIITYYLDSFDLVLDQIDRDWNENHPKEEVKN